MSDLTTETPAPSQPGARLLQALSENWDAEDAPMPVQLQAARNRVASAACTAALQAARNRVARLEDMDHQLRDELHRVVGQRDDWSARSSRLEKEVDNLHAQLTLLEAETHLPSSPMASPRSSESGAVVHRMSVERRNMQGELLRLQRRDEVQTQLLEQLRAQLLAATEGKAGSLAPPQPAKPSAEVAHLQRQEAALRAELSKAEFASARQAAQLLELQGTAEQHAGTAAELAQAQGALKAQLSKQDAAASAAAARVAELQAQLDEERAGAAEQRAILQQLRRQLRGSAGTGTQEAADQQTLGAEIRVRQQQEQSQQQLAEQSAAAAEQAAQFEAALKQQQQAAAAASAGKLEEQAAQLEAQLEKEKAERQAAAGALAKLEVQLSDRAGEQQAAAASAAKQEAERQAAATSAATQKARLEQQEVEHQAAAAVLEAQLKNRECVQQQAAAASAQLEQVQADLQASEAQVADLEAQVSDRASQQQQAAAAASAQLAQVQADLQASKAQVVDLESRVSNQASEQQQAAAASAQLEQVQADLEASKAQVADLESRISDRANEQQQAAAAAAQLEQVQADLQASEAQVADLEAQVSDRASQQQQAAAAASAQLAQVQADLQASAAQNAEQLQQQQEAAARQAGQQPKSVEAPDATAAAEGSSQATPGAGADQAAPGLALHPTQGSTRTGSMEQAAAGSSSSPLTPAGSLSSVAEQADAQAQVAALKESLSHYKAAAQMARERVLELEGQRAAADKQWQEKLAGEQASSQQHHLRAGRMEADLHRARQLLHQVEQRWSPGSSSPGAIKTASPPASGANQSVTMPLASPAAAMVDKPFPSGTHGTPLPEGDPASASHVGSPGLRQSTSEGVGPIRDLQLHRQVAAETKARKRAESCSAEHAASSARLHLECIDLTRSNKQLNVDNQRLELQLLAARRTVAAATEQLEAAQVGDAASRQVLDLAQVEGSAGMEPGGSVQQRSGSATASPHTRPPHARSRSDGDSLHSLRLVTPPSSDRERPATPSSSTSSEQARLHGSNPGSAQGTAWVLRLTPDGAAGPAGGSSSEATQDTDAGATSPHTSTASAGGVQGKDAAEQGNDGLQKELTVLQSHLAEVQGELRTCRQELHSEREAAQEQIRRLEQRGSKLEVKLSKARQQAEARAAEVSAAQVVSEGLQSKLEELERSQQGVEKQATKLKVQVPQMTAELQAAEKQMQASHQQLASLRRSMSQQGQRSSRHMYSQFLIPVLLGIAAILLVKYVHA